MSSVEEILAGYDDLQAGQEAFYMDLHQHPELSHQEHRTAQCVAGKLQEYDFTVHAGIGGTGVVGVLANGGGPTVLLRAELDALPVREDTGVREGRPWRHAAAHHRPGGARSHDHRPAADHRVP